MGHAPGRRLAALRSGRGRVAGAEPARLPPVRRDAAAFDGRQRPALGLQLVDAAPTGHPRRLQVVGAGAAVVGKRHAARPSAPGQGAVPLRLTLLGHTRPTRPQSGQRPLGRVPCASTWRKSDPYSVIASTQQPGTGEGSFMICSIGRGTAHLDPLCCIVTIHAKCGRAFLLEAHSQGIVYHASVSV